jgi:hypothetical protein
LAIHPRSISIESNQSTTPPSRTKTTSVLPSKNLMDQRNRAQQEVQDTQDVAARGKSRDEQQRLTKLIDEEKRRFYRAMFWVAFPIGLTALVIGMFVPTIPVGTGLSSGGLSTLTAGCYSYWDDMGDALRFFSLLLVLAVLITLGLIKFARPTTTTPPPPP